MLQAKEATTVTGDSGFYLNAYHPRKQENESKEHVLAP